MFLLFIACTSGPVAPAPPRGADPKAAVWAPGDPIPGWDDADCTVPVAGNIFEIHGLDTWSVVGVADARAGLPDVAEVRVELRDCARFPCTPGAVRPEGDPFTELAFSTEIEEGVRRGLGWYGPDGDVARPVRAETYGVVGYGTNVDAGGDPANLHGQACVARARPDEVSGVVYHQFFESFDPVGIYWYSTIDMWSSFRAVLPDHAGVLVADPAAFPAAALLETLPDDIRAFHWEYDAVSYDDAWPWDEITDPAIRQAVYDRYLPVNQGE